MIFSLVLSSQSDGIFVVLAVAVARGDRETVEAWLKLTEPKFFVMKAADFNRSASGLKLRARSWKVAPSRDCSILLFQERLLLTSQPAALLKEERNFRPLLNALISNLSCPRVIHPATWVVPEMRAAFAADNHPVQMRQPGRQVAERSEQRFCADEADSRRHLDEVTNSRGPSPVLDRHAHPDGGSPLNAVCEM